jgi:hypothetical protein
MNRPSPLLRTFHAARRRQAFAALVLACLLAALGNAGGVNAQEETYGFFVDVLDPSAVKLCIGETTEYAVQVLYSNQPLTDKFLQDPPATITEHPVARLAPGTIISADVTNLPNGSITGARTLLVNSPSPTLVRPGIVVFTFKAERIGSGTVVFNAEVVESGTRFNAKPSEPLRVEVIPCKYWVFAHSRWFAQYAYGAVKADAFIYNGEMTIDPGGSYRGEAAVQLLARAAVPGCGAAVSLANGTASLGAVPLEETLSVRITYQLSAWQDAVNCPMGSGGSSGNARPALLDFWLPMSGGHKNLPQVLTGAGPGPADGSVDVFVFPLDEPR